MVEEVGLAPLAFIAVSLFAFAWTVRLAYNVRQAVSETSLAWNARVDSLEDLALDLRREADSLKSELRDKIDSSYLEKRIGGLVELIQGSRTAKRK